MDSWDEYRDLFAYKHLPENLQSVSREFYTIALSIINKGSMNHVAKTTALLKLLEAKDAAVRFHALSE